MRRLLLWTALAVGGLLVAVGVTTAATSLTSQRVGLQAEPIDAGESLAPAATSFPDAAATPEATPRPKPERTPTPERTRDARADTDRGADGGPDRGARGRR